MRQYLLLTFFLLLLTSGNFLLFNKSNDKILINNSTRDTILSFYGLSFKLDTIDPIKFIELIKVGKERKNIPWIMIQPYDDKEKDSSDVAIMVPKDWIKYEHINKLISLLNDNELTYPVYSLYANVAISLKPCTTVSIEALRLIEGYKRKSYPSLWPEFIAKDTNSVEFIKRKQELTNWWNNNKK